MNPKLPLQGSTRPRQRIQPQVVGTRVSRGGWNKHRGQQQLMHVLIVKRHTRGANKFLCTSPAKRIKLHRIGSVSIDRATPWCASLIRDFTSYVVPDEARQPTKNRAASRIRTQFRSKHASVHAYPHPCHTIHMNRGEWEMRGRHVHESSPPTVTHTRSMHHMQQLRTRELQQHRRGDRYLVGSQ